MIDLHSPECDMNHFEYWVPMAWCLIDFYVGTGELKVIIYESWIIWLQFAVP